MLPFKLLARWSPELLGIILVPSESVFAVFYQEARCQSFCIRLVWHGEWEPSKFIELNFPFCSLISLKLISSLYTIRPQVINHRRWEQSAPHPRHLKKSFLLRFFFFFCDRASKVARLLFMVNSVWSISGVLMWQTRDHCSRTHWTFFFNAAL